MESVKKTLGECGVGSNRAPSAHGSWSQLRRCSALTPQWLPDGQTGKSPLISQPDIQQQESYPCSQNNCLDIHIPAGSCQQLTQFLIDTGARYPVLNIAGCWCRTRREELKSLEQMLSCKTAHFNLWLLGEKLESANLKPQKNSRGYSAAPDLKF